MKPRHLRHSIHGGGWSTWRDVGGLRLVMWRWEVLVLGGLTCSCYCPWPFTSCESNQSIGLLRMWQVWGSSMSSWGHGRQAATSVAIQWSGTGYCRGDGGLRLVMWHWEVLVLGCLTCSCY